MTTFAYQARDPLGHLTSGTLEGESRDDALARLKRDGYQIVELDEEEGGQGLIPRRVKQADIIYATSQLAVMVDTGITLSSALQGLISQEKNAKLKHLLMSLQSSVEGGTDFSTG